jgi:hypothetical protein
MIELRYCFFIAYHLNQHARRERLGDHVVAIRQQLMLAIGAPVATLAYCGVSRWKQSSANAALRS